MPRGATQNVSIALSLFLLLCAPSPTGRAQQGDPSGGDAWVAPSYKSRQANPVASGPSSIATGKQIYLQQCLVCHGSSGKGDGPAGAVLQPPAANLVDGGIQAQSDGALFWKISTGRAPMPAFETIISEEDRWNIVNYIRSLAPGS